MKSFLGQVSPLGAAGDFLEVWKRPTPHRWQILGVACAATFALFMLFIPESQRAAPEMPQITYISTLAEGRSDAEIIASNCANQQAQDAYQARLAQDEEERRDMYRALGRATFLDVDEMERQAEAERAAAEAARNLPSAQELAAAVAEYCARAAG